MHRAAIIGAGFIAADKHLPAWRRLRRKVRVVAVCDVDRSRAEAVGRQFGVPAAYADVRRMLEAERPDFVDICTPPAAHADLAVAALQADAQVLVEKPLAVNAAECERIIEAERASRGRVEVAHTDLFHPSIVEARRRLARGDIGEFSGMRIFYSTPIDLWMTDPGHFAHRLPGGSIGETGPHVVYLARSFVGPIRDVRVRGRKVLPRNPWSPFDDYRLDLAGERAACSAVLTYTGRHSAYLVELWGADSVLKIDMQSKVLVHYRRANRSPAGIGLSALGEAAQIASTAVANGAGCALGRFRNTHDRLIAGVVERSTGGLPPVAGAEDGLEVVRVMGVIGEQLQAQGGCGT